MQLQLSTRETPRAEAAGGAAARAAIADFVSVEPIESARSTYGVTVDVTVGVTVEATVQVTVESARSTCGREDR